MAVHAFGHFLSVPGGGHLQAMLDQESGQQLADVVIVVDHQDVRRGIHTDIIMRCGSRVG